MKTPFDPVTLNPADARMAIRRGIITGPTTGFCAGYAQGNLVVLPKALAWDFLLFCQRNPKACPLLEVADAGERTFAQFAPGSDIATDIPRYHKWSNISRKTKKLFPIKRNSDAGNSLLVVIFFCIHVSSLPRWKTS